MDRAALRFFDPRLAEVIAVAGMFHRAAFEAALQAAKMDPNLLEAHLTALEVYRKLGRAEEAEKEAETVEKLKSKPQ